MMAGKNKLVRDLEAYHDKVLDRVREIIRETAAILQREARIFAAKDTGYLADSIEMDVSPDGLSASVTVGAFYGVDICPLQQQC